MPHSHTRQDATVCVPVLGWEMLCNVLWHARSEDPVALPCDVVSRVRALCHVAGEDVARTLLTDSLEDALCAGSLNTDHNPWKLHLKRFGNAFGHLQVDRGIPAHLAFLASGLDQLRRDALGRRRSRPHGHPGPTECTGRSRGAEQNLSSRGPVHDVPPPEPTIYDEQSASLHRVEGMVAGCNGS